MDIAGTFGLLLFLVLVGFVVGGIRIINQYERGVVLTLGRYSGIRLPGLRVVVPVFQQMIKVDIRSTPVDVPRQEVITKDNVTIIVDAETDRWGIDVENVKIQNIELPQDMKRAMAKQAEAERERRAVIINAAAEKAAAQQVAEAAAMLAKVPGGMGIRTL